MKREYEQWFPLPEQYKSFRNPDALKKFAIAYMKTNYAGWKPLRIENYKVFARWEGKHEQD